VRIRATIAGRRSADTYVPDRCACGTAGIPRRSGMHPPDNCYWPPSWSTARSAGSRRQGAGLQIKDK